MAVTRLGRLSAKIGKFPLRNELQFGSCKRNDPRDKPVASLISHPHLAGRTETAASAAAATDAQGRWEKETVRQLIPLLVTLRLSGSALCCFPSYAPMRLRAREASGVSSSGLSGKDAASHLGGGTNRIWAISSSTPMTITRMAGPSKSNHEQQAMRATGTDDPRAGRAQRQAQQSGRELRLVNAAGGDVAQKTPGNTR